MDEINPDGKLYKCSCGEFSFLEVIHDSDDDFYYFTISYYPKSFWQKIKAIYAIIRGSRFGASEEVVLTIEDAQDLSDFIGLRPLKKYGKPAKVYPKSS